MSSTAQVLKNWDWDKLQEKRAKQKGFTPPPRDPEPEEPRPDNTDDRERRDFFGGGNPPLRYGRVYDLARELFGKYLSRMPPEYRNAYFQL